MNDIDKWRLNLLKAVEAQANDETLWALPIDRLPTIHEAYHAQSLRWLHRVIEEDDQEALAKICGQANGDV